jgi:predicted transcriptional regulator
MICTTRSDPGLTAADVMSRCGITLRDELPLWAAADLLARTRAGWAPVVDAWGRCVGTLSAADILRWAKDRARAGRDRPCPSYVADWQVLEPCLPAQDLVQDFMTPDPVLVPRTARVDWLARTMLGAGVCRLIVIDGRERPVGAVLCSDVLGHGLGDGFT